ncbi:hypothetical protein ACWEJ6_12290 [Nonomuraea sp. NPDC004702]
MYPTWCCSGGGFHPPDEQIVPQTTRNKEALLMLAEYADCVYRAIGKEAQYCATAQSQLTMAQVVVGMGP